MKYTKALFSVAAGLGLILGVAGCGGEPAKMPDVETSRLDLALSDIERAGYNPDDVEIVGGGALGVVDESNWTVCEQQPTAGATIEQNLRLTVDRECEDAAPEAAGESSDQPTVDSVEPETSEPVGEDSESSAAEDAPASDERFRMPRLVGLILQDAQDLLQEHGSYLLTQTDATGAGRFQVLDAHWKVCYQIPRAGRMVSTLKLIDLGVVKVEEACP